MNAHLTPGRIWLGCLGIILLAVAAIYALSDLVAFLAVAAIAVWLGGIVGGLAAVGAWADEHKRADVAEEEVARRDREEAGLATEDDAVAKRWVDLGAFATWTALGCTKPEQYAGCEEIAKAVLRSVLPIRDATRTEQIARLEAECNAHAAENARLTEERLTDPATATTVPVPLLRAGKGLLTVVPPVADEDDYWARLMKATEER